MTNVDGQECWDMSSEKYCTAAVTNVESVLEKRNLRLPPNCAKLCYPSELWLSSRDGCDRKAQGIWSTMVPRTHWDPEVVSLNG